MQFTDEQLKGWKEKHGELYQVSVEGYSCILHKPTRKDLSYISSVKDPIKMSELLLEQTWVAGDEEIKTNDELFMSVVSKMDEIVKFKEAEVKKL